MPTLDYTVLGKDMAAAAVDVLKKKSAEIKRYADQEFRKLAMVIKDIESQVLSGAMTPRQAKLELQMAANAAKAVLLTCKGVGKIGAEQAINTAFSVAKAPVNKALGFLLL